MKCEKCNKKLRKIYGIMSMCKCKKEYCAKHLHNHNCTFNYRNKNKVLLQKQLLTVTQKKVNLI